MRRAYFFIDRSMIGDSACMKTLRSNLWNNLFTHHIEIYNRYLLNRMEDFSTLLLGETGTGKGTAASAIGRSGFIPLDRRKKCFEESFTRSFVSINLSQFPETLIESALFGHKKGSFTGAVEDYQGVFERCSPYGAILLDEIGEVSKPIQIKLLQVLQERFFNPVGSQKKSRFNGRVIAATNRPVEEIRSKGLFRDDFYYRLSSDIIIVPPLRQRISENPSELDLLLEKTVERMIGKPSYELAAMVRNVIEKQLGANYAWPGNVRELEQCVRRVILKGLYTGEKGSDSADLCRHLVSGVEQGDIKAVNLISGYCYLLYQRHRTFEEVARRTGLDRRTVKKYIQSWDSGNELSAETFQVAGEEIQ
jgi:transcriptional regulator with GAF, ATPase, and Fis domain